jgi:hypothetical protein
MRNSMLIALVACLAMVCAPTAFAQGLYPLAIPGGRVEPVFTQMEEYLVDKLLADPTPNEVLAAKLMSALKDDFGDPAANFSYQQMIVGHAVLLSMSADPSLQDTVNKILSDGLREYWDRSQVEFVDAEAQSAAAMHFIELSQAIIRTAPAGDPKTMDYVSDIWDAWSASHPLFGEPSLWSYASTPAGTFEYATFWCEIAEAVGMQAPEFSATIQAFGPQFDECIRRCKKRLGCVDGPITNIVCGALCTIPCLVDNVVNPHH